MQDTNLPKDIKRWVVLAIEINKDREQHNYNVLFDIAPVANFNIKLNGANKKTLENDFLEMLLQFSKTFIDSAIQNKRSDRVSDSFESIARTNYLIDFSYAIVSDILIPDYSKSQKKKWLDLSDSLDFVYKIIATKKNALFRLIDPFDDLYLEMNEQEQYIKDGYELISLLGFSKDVSLDNFSADLHKAYLEKPDDYPKIIIIEYLHRFLKDNNLAFEVNIIEDTKSLLAKIHQVLPEFIAENYQKNYDKKKELAYHQMQLFGENINLDIPYSGGSRALIEKLNPFIEKNTEKSLVSISKYPDIYVVIPTVIKEELLKNEIFFKPQYKNQTSKVH